MAIAALFCAVLGVVFWLDSVEALDPVFRYFPPVIWAYFVPMLCTTFGITPAESPVYEWMSTYLLPLSLFLLMITVDLTAILRLGPMALFMLCAGTLGIMVGGPIAFGLFSPLFEDPNAWKGFAALSGSWIGGTANMVAMKQSVGTPDSTLGPLLVVDVVVGYGWMGVLIFLSAYQAHFDDWIRADTTAMDDLNEQMENAEETRRPVTLSDFSIMIGVALAATVASQGIGAWLPEIAFGMAEPIIRTSTWTILLVVTAGLFLSFTPLQKLEDAGASRLGYFALYLLLTSIGAKADLAAVLDVPFYLLAGALWIAIHIAFLMAAAWMARAPLFFVATGSMANVGGAASAPIVAGVYLPAMAPVGLLMGVAGYILGIYAALGCSWLIGLVAMGL